MSEELKNHKVTLSFDTLMKSINDQASKDHRETRVMLHIFGITDKDPISHTLEECEEAIAKVCDDAGLDTEAIFRFMGRHHSRFSELVPFSPLFTASMQQRAKEIRPSVYE